MPPRPTVRPRPRLRTRVVAGIVVIVVSTGLASLAGKASPQAVASGAVSIEPEQGALTGGVTVGTDAAASGGQYVQFGGPTPTPSPVPTTTPGPASTSTPAPTPNPTPTPSPAAVGFVTHQGVGLALNGQPYHFAGFNIYQANSVSNCSYTMGTGVALGQSLTLIGSGPNLVFRSWFFETLATSNGTLSWTVFDHTLAVAAAHGYKVIVTLTNQWGSCEQPSGYKPLSWYQGGYRQREGTMPLSYRDYVAQVVARYQNNPAVLSWQLVNEAEANTAQGAACPEASAASALRAFTDDVGGLIHSIDHNHLVNLGTMGGGQCGIQGGDFAAVNASPGNDWCEFHDYNHDTTAFPSDLPADIAACTSLGRPVFVGEMGIQVTSAGTQQQRAADFDAKFAAQWNAGVAGSLVWSWDLQGEDGTYKVAAGDPTVAIVRKYQASVPRTMTPSLQLAAASVAAPQAAAIPGIALTPPMGFNHYNHFGNSVNETMIHQITDAMVVNGMQAAGYRYVNVDDSWAGARDAQGAMTANTNFTSGMAALAAYVHSKGFKFGLYTSPSTVTCAGRTGSGGHFQQDVATFAAWGVDYIKLDWCGSDYSPSGAAAIAQQWESAIQATGRPMVLSINAGGSATVGPWAKNIVNTWRTSDDICASWFNQTQAHDPAARDCFNTQYHKGVYDYIYSNEAANAPSQSPGHWGDPDMLEIGNPGLNFEEEKTQFSIWAMWSAPLIDGNDPRTMTGSDDSSRILLNREVIAVDQDPGGVMATKVQDTGGLQVWRKPLAGGDTALLFVNAGNAVSDISTSWSTVGLTGAVALRDLWTHTDLGTFTSGHTARGVPPHGSVLLIACAGAAPAPSPAPTAVPTQTPAPARSPAPSASPAATPTAPACTTTVPTTTFGRVFASVPVSTAGTYAVWSRMEDASGPNGYLLQVDGACPIAVGNQASTATSTWAWTIARDRTAGSVIMLTLGAGTHTVVLLGTQAGLHLDRVLLLTATTCVPVSTGSNCTVLPVPTPSPGVTSSPPPSPTPQPPSTTSPAPGGCPAGWTCADIGTAAHVGTQTVTGATWSVSGGGSDIFGTADHFHYVFQPLAGDGGIAATVRTQTNTSSWAKAGVMIRSGTAAGSPYYFAFVTPGHGVAVQYRSHGGGGATDAVKVPGTSPITLRVSRTGTTYTAFTSTDGGATWNVLTASTRTLALGPYPIEGLAVTAHNDRTTSTVVSSIPVLLRSA